MAISRDPPSFGQGEAAGRDRFQLAFARTANAILFASPILVNTMLHFQDRPLRLAGTAPFSVLGLLGMFLLLRGSTEVAFRLLVYGVWACTVNALAWTGGLAGPSLVILPVVILFSGWFAGPRATVALTLLSTITVFGLALAADRGWPLPMAVVGTPFHTALVVSVTLAAAGALGYFATLSLNSRIERAEGFWRKFEAIFRSGPTASLIDRADDGTFIDCNDAFAELIGLPRDAILGRKAQDLDYWQDPGDRARLYEILERDGFVRDFVTRFVRPDGEVRHCLIAGQIVAIDGERRLVSQIADITRLKLAESAQREAETRLRLQVSVHELTERVARVGHWITDPAQDRVQWSPALFDISGVEPRGPMTIATARELVAPREAREYEAARARPDGTPHVFTIRRPDGEIRWTRTSIRRTPEGSPSGAGYFGVVQDITEEHQAKLALERLNAELERRIADSTRELRAANAELDAFSYSVAHDLNAPLRSINGFAALLEEGSAGRLDAQGRDFLARIRNSTQRMANLIEDLLRLARLSRVAVVRERVDLTRLVREIASELQATQPQRAVDWQVEDGLEASADVGLARSLLQNLVGNAWKYTRDQPRPVISIGALRPESGPVEFFVRDNGAGFDMAGAPRLFAPFHRLHSDSEFAGTGIGLAIVQRIVNRHGGQVRGKSVPGEGAVFHFTLPDPAQG